MTLSNTSWQHFVKWDSMTTQCNDKVKSHNDSSVFNRRRQMSSHLFSRYSQCACRHIFDTNGTPYIQTCLTLFQHSFWSEVFPLIFEHFRAAGACFALDHKLSGLSLKSDFSKGFPCRMWRIWVIIVLQTWSSVVLSCVSVRGFSCQISGF